MKHDRYKKKFIKSPTKVQEVLTIEERIEALKKRFHFAKYLLPQL